MEQWLESVYTDGSATFVSNPHPAFGETVTVRIRFYEDAPVKAVILRTIPNGGNWLIDMQEERREQGFVYYACTLPMIENRMQYHFYLVCEDVVYYYTQRAITTHVPDHSFDFVLMTDYVQPEWVKGAVFYQIFPERFCNGDAHNDVKPGEFSVDGFPALRMNWNDKPLEFSQSHCLDFFGGDLMGVKKKIPYLKELGVTAVYLNPIFAAPSIHKYDCIDYFHVDEHFGGDDALAELSRALHDNGMKLILDISINHTGANHKWFNRDGLYFDKSVGAYNNPDAEERKYYFFHPDNSYDEWMGVHNLPTLNYSADELRDIIYRAQESVLRKWLKPPYSIDGWRFDVADVFARNGKVQLAHELWPEIRQAIREENPQGYILAEDWGDCAQYMQGNEWDSPMNYYGFGRPVRQLLGEPDSFQRQHPVLRSVGYRFTAQDFRNRVMQHLARIPWALWENQFNLFDSHDIARLHNNPDVNREEYLGAVMLQFAMIGAPSIYYGDEAGIDGWTETIEGCRCPMPWDKDFTDSEIYRLNRTLAHLKQESDALKNGGFQFLYADNGVVAVARFTKEEAYAAVLSTNDEEKRIVLPLGAIGARGIDRDVTGRNADWKPLDKNHVELTLNPHGAHFLRLTMK